MALDETDLVLEILDSRNPIGTHNQAFEKFLYRTRPQIKVLLILNKSDMVPRKVISAWINYFREQKYFVYAVSARYNHGVFEILDHLRMQIKKEEVNVLIVGYPNTGKSTLIQALTKNKKSIGVSSQAGFTRAIKKVKITNNLFLIDTPGVIPLDETDEKEIAIKACMVADKLEDPLSVVEAIYQLLPKKKFEDYYKIQLSDDDDCDRFIEKVGRRMGKLKSGGCINEYEVQKLIIRDWQNNRLKFYLVPPNWDEHQSLDDSAIGMEDQDLFIQTGVRTTESEPNTISSTEKKSSKKKKNNNIKTQKKNKN